MSDNRGVLVIGEDAILQGEIRNCREIEIYGYVEGKLDAGNVVVQPNGRLFGTIRAESAEVHGELQGDVRVKQLIAIKSTGTVTGNVKYGRLAMDEGGELSASVRNVPPAIAGDLDLSVVRGRSVRLTTADLTALDPDDTAQHLIFSVSSAANGYLAIVSAPRQPITSFTQEDLQQARVVFVHDGSSADTARFDVSVADRSGATSGSAHTINVAVRTG